MKEYIEKAVALEALSKSGVTCNMRAHKIVAAIPAADVVEARHGRWKNGGNGLYDTCSVCGKEIYLAIPMSYCPECGAQLDGKEDGR